MSIIVFDFPQVWYNPHEVILAWDHLISGLMTEPLLSNASNFRHDMVDLTRQSMQEIFHLLYSKLLEVYLEKNSTAIEYPFNICPFISNVREL